MSIWRISFKTSLLFIAALVLGSAASEVLATDHCVSCHKDTKFQVQNKILFDYYKYWEESTHDSAGVICIDCHGGNEATTEKNEAHKPADFSSLTAEDITSHKKIAVVCGNCHKAIYLNFKTSKHYKALLKDRNSPNCVTCHGSMNTEIYDANNISRACASCHNKSSKQTPEIGKKAEDLLTRISIIRAYNKWVIMNYNDDRSDTVKAINKRYKDMVRSWHQFDFKDMEEKTQKLTIDMRSLVNKGLAEKRKKKKDDK